MMRTLFFTGVFTTSIVSAALAFDGIGPDEVDPSIVAQLQVDGIVPDDIGVWARVDHVIPDTLDQEDIDFACSDNGRERWLRGDDIHVIGHDGRPEGIGLLAWATDGSGDLCLVLTRSVHAYY